MKGFGSDGEELKKTGWPSQAEPRREGYYRGQAFRLQTGEIS
jgi:hypothetical protein